MEVLKIFGVSLGLTLAIELALAAVFRVRSKRGFLIVLLANILTNPAAVFLCLAVGPYLGKWFLHFQLLVEAAVVLTEGRVYRDFREDLNAVFPPLLLSLILNACSYGTGLILFPLP